MAQGSALVIAAKYPVPGGVKTRLAGRLGFGLAAELYRAFLRDLDAKLSRAFPAVYWAYTPAEAPFPDFLGPGRNYLIQEGDDLGERMFELFRTLLIKGYEKVVLAGSDLPHLTPQLIGAAFEKLDKCDVVLGPAEDGGYFLIGMRDTYDLFSCVSWSTPLVFAQTLVKAAELGLSVDFLPQTFDVDEPEDLDKLEALLTDKSLRRSMPRTSLALSRLRREDETVRQSKVGKYFAITADEAAREEVLCEQLVSTLGPTTKVRTHMALAATVANVLVGRFRADLGVPLTGIAVAAARCHDTFRSSDQRYRLRPYGAAPKGLFLPHDGHEAKLAYALRRAGAKTIAKIVWKHDVLRSLCPEERTIDENIVLLADAMVEAESIVPVSVRRDAIIRRHATDNPPLKRAFETAYNVVEQTLQMYFDAGLDRRRLFQELDL